MSDNKEVHEKEQSYNEDKQRLRLDIYLQQMFETGASDLHIKPLQKPRLRINGELEPIDQSEEYTKADTLELGKELARSDFEKLIEKKSLDFTYITPSQEDFRYRVILGFQKDGLSIVIRKISNEIKTMDELDLPQQIKKMLEEKRGLVVVTGATGSGKSTTMASLIEEVNMTKGYSIITIEDPIEYTYEDKKSFVMQRSIGQDTLSFNDALRDALRQDPNVIVVGEVRDTTTVNMLLHAAETGHLVITTMHTTNASETVQRIIGMFPPEEQNRVRMVLSTILVGIVSQRLVKNTKKSRSAVVEVLFNTPRISELIKTNRDDEIPSALEEGTVNYGTQTFDEHLHQMILSGLVTEEEALANSTNKSNLQLKIKGIGQTKFKQEQEEAEKKKVEQQKSLEDNNTFDLNTTVEDEIKAKEDIDNENKVLTGIKIKDDNDEENQDI